MQETINNYKNKFNQLKAERQLLKKQYKEKNSNLKDLKQNLIYLLEAQKIIQETVQETQSKIKIHITDIVNLALDSIPFPNRPDYFDLEFVLRRNQTECDLFLVKNGHKLSDVIYSDGGGIADIVSFALQIACWSLQKGKKSNTIILDEPFKNINDPGNEFNLKEYVSEMIKMISSKLGIQFIIIGSNNDFQEIGDKVFKVYLDENNDSKVKVVKE